MVARAPSQYVVASLVSSLGLWSHGVTWTMSDNMLLTKLWYQIPKVKDIAEYVGRTTGAVYEHAHKLNLPSRRDPSLTVVLFGADIPQMQMRKVRRKLYNPAQRVKKRKCLTCSEFFKSQGWGHRICRRCANWMDGLPA